MDPIENNSSTIEIGLPLEKKGLSWQVTTILVTEVVFAGAIISIILFALAAIFKSSLQDALNVFPLLKTAIYICGIVPGLFFGINYVIGKSEVNENRARNISLWLAGLLVVGYGMDVFGAIRQNEDYIFGLLNLLIIPPVVYLFSRRVLNNQEKIKQSFIGRLGVRKLEFAFVGTNVILVLILVLVMADVVFNNNRTVLAFLPGNTKQQLEQLMNERQTDDKVRLQLIDGMRIEKGQYITRTLQINKQINGRYPDLLKNSMAAKVIGEILSPDDLKLQEETGTALDNFSYQSVNDGQNFQLCIELSTGQKCWNEQGIIPPETASPASTKMILSTTTQPSITILSPNGGETVSYGNIYAAGDLYFRWTTSQEEKYVPTSNKRAYVIDGNGNIVRDDPVWLSTMNLGGGVFETSFPGERNLEINGKYKIKVCDYLDSKEHCDSSDNYFIIVQ